MIGNFRYRILKRWFRKPVLVLQVEQIDHHMMPLGGSGYYDEWQTKRWRDVRPDELLLEVQPVYKTQQEINVDLSHLVESLRTCLSCGNPAIICKCPNGPVL